MTRCWPGWWGSKRTGLSWTPAADRRPSWAAAVALGAITGTFDAELGFSFLLPTFAAVIVGGLGRPLGAAIGALIIGTVTSLPATTSAAETRRWGRS